MAEKTKIEWATHTFNPWIGCTRVSPACDHCYAERSAKRFQVAWGAGELRRRTSEQNWAGPRRWNHEAAENGERPRVFCASLADVFDNEVPIEWRLDLMDLIRQTPNLDWLLLTKRIGNVTRLIEQSIQHIEQTWQVDDRHHVGWRPREELRNWLGDWVVLRKPPENIWLGATVVNQTEVDRDVLKLLDTPAAVRFLSIEPMLGPINLQRIYTKNASGFAGTYDSLAGDWRPGDLPGGATGLVSIDWIIAGGESGAKARPSHPDWFRSLRDQCVDANVPFLFKQWGEWKPISQMSGSEHDALYKSRRRAPEAADQGIFDEIYGRSCSVDHRMLDLDGEIMAVTDPGAYQQGRRSMMVFKIGKQVAGRRLDGDLWAQYPHSPCVGRAA